MDAVVEQKRGVPPDIRRYSSYRDFLRDVYLYKRSTRQSFSYRLFSKRAGFTSPNFLQMVIHGKRNLSLESAPKVAKALGLTKAETEYFLALVPLASKRRGDSSDGADRARAMAAAKKLLAKEIPKAQSIVLSKWYHLVIREMVFLKDFEASGAWISRRLRDLVTPEEAEQSLSLLVKAGFLKEVRSKLVPADPVIDTGDCFDFVRILQTHRETLAVWQKVLEKLGPEERELGLLNLSIRREQIPELKERVRRFQDEILGWLQDNPEANEVVQLGTYLVPLTGIS